MELETQVDFTRPVTPDEIIYDRIVKSTTLEDFVGRLSDFRCRRCTLAELPNKVVVCRGNMQAKIMMVGEAPGKMEDRYGKPFVGPAGELTDKIFASVGINTNRDMYIGNVCKCRPVAEKGSGRENFTPLAEQRKQCKPYILREIELLQPKIVIACGLVAATSLFDLGEKTLMKHIAGSVFTLDNVPELKDRQLFVIYHPAAILHAQGEKEEELKKIMWDHVKKLRKEVDRLGIKLQE